MDEQVDDFHAASVKLCGSHDAIWINVFESASGQEPCYFLLPDKGNEVFTGPEWCRYIGLRPKAKRRAWQRLTTLAEANGHVAVGTTIEEVFKILNEQPAKPTSSTPAAKQSKQYAQEKTNSERLLEPQTESQSVLEAGQVISLTTHHDSHGGAEQVSEHLDVEKRKTDESHPPRTQAVQNIVLTPPAPEQPQLPQTATTVPGIASQQLPAQPAVEAAAQDQTCAQHARIVTYLGSKQQQEEPEVQSITQSQVPADAVTNRQPSMTHTGKSSAAAAHQADRQGSVKSRPPSKNRYVRVCFSNHETKVTKYALWSNAGALLSQQRTDPKQPLLMEPKFLLCSDSWEVKFPQPVRGVDLIELLEIDPRGSHAIKHIRLLQRYRTPSGHCFYPGTSVAQVIAVSTVAPAPGTTDDASLSWEGWDEAATDPSVVYGTGQQGVYVMLYSKFTRTTVYAQMKLPDPSGPIKPVSIQFTQCNHMLKPFHTGQPVNIRHLAKAAGTSMGSKAAGECLKLACLIQSLTMPSGVTLPPGTPLSRVISELEEVNNRQEDKETATPHEPATNGSLQPAQVGTKRHQGDGEDAADRPSKAAKCSTQDAAHSLQALPQLVFVGNAISQASAEDAWHALVGLLQRYGCGKDAIDQLLQKHTNWLQPEQPLEHSFALKYAELSAAVELADKEYVVEVLQNEFGLAL